MQMSPEPAPLIRVGIFDPRLRTAVLLSAFVLTGDLFWLRLWKWDGLPHITKEADMSTKPVRANDPSSDAGVSTVAMKFEVVIIPVSDVDRAKEFYSRLGWRLDADFRFDNDFRVVQFTPPGSACSVAFGKGVTSAAPGSASHLELVVSDIEAARDELLSRGVDTVELFHGSPFDPSKRISGPDPQRTSYRSYGSFNDPDGNEWLLQEVTVRLPGRIDPGANSFGSASDLASALRRAEAAHGEHEKRTGQRDANWPDWYAKYIAAEQAGTELPK
jgi:catechol 2,3-dioxygenase-like lactoylglutathione lyase family enzyme